MDNKRAIKNVADVVRDTKNWLSVLKTEHKVSDSAIKLIKEKLDLIGERLELIK